MHGKSSFANSQYEMAWEKSGAPTAGNPAKSIHPKPPIGMSEDRQENPYITREVLNRGLACGSPDALEEAPRLIPIHTTCGEVQTVAT